MERRSRKGVEADLEVLVVEELCVVEAWAHDALVAGAHGVVDPGVGVGDDDELAGERPVRGIDGEVALVLEHRLDDDLVRHGEELLVEGPHHDGRPLAEVDDLVEDALRRVDMGTAPLGLEL